MALSVSDHALVRYLERVMGLDVEAVRTRILNECRAGGSLAVAVRVDGHVLHIRQTDLGRCVVTVRPSSYKNHRRCPRPKSLEAAE